MLKEFTCIVCPNGCNISVDFERLLGEGDGEKIIKLNTIEGHTCSKGETYVKQELEDPRRNIATSVLVKGGVLPLASVRLTNPIPKNQIFHALEEIKKVQLIAPVMEGDVVISRILDTDSDVIVTRSVEVK